VRGGRPRRYILASDGSEASLRAARFLVLQSCLGPDDEIFVIYVFPLPSDPECYEGVTELPRDAGDERVRRAAAPLLRRTVDALAGAPGRLEEVTLLGNPAKEIVEFATNLEANLVVAGTRGRSAESEHYLGSVSSALVHRAPCSVLIVR
jgi:nucleotide-binding universal stress UspA family protein